MWHAGADGAVLQFEDVAPPGGFVNYAPNNPYTEAGFTITPSNVNCGVADENSGLQMMGNPSDFFLFQGLNDLTLTATGGGLFDLSSLDIGITNSSGEKMTDITFTGTVAGGGTLFALFEDVDTTITATLDWSNLTSVRIASNDDAGVDNVHATIVPEPSSLALLLLAGTAAVATKRIRCRCR